MGVLRLVLVTYLFDSKLQFSQFQSQITTFSDF